MNGEPGQQLPKSAVLTSRLIDFAVAIINIVEQLPENRLGSHIGSQLLRAGSSPAPNYAEAVSAESKRDFVHKLGIALKELRETSVWLRIVRRKSLILQSDLLEEGLRECNELIAIFAASISTARKNMREQSHKQPDEKGSWKRRQ
jgi:four helix bundle protein